MDTVQEVKKIVGKKEHLSNDDKYVKHLKYYKELLRKGIIVKQKYTIPPVDTTGKIIYELINN